MPWLFVRLFGDYGLADCRGLLRELTESFASLAGVSVICDCREGRASLSFRELGDLAAFFQERGAVLSGVRWAVVVPGMLDYGLARSAGLMVTGVPFTYNVFQDAEAACHW